MTPAETAARALARVMWPSREVYCCAARDTRRTRRPVPMRHVVVVGLSEYSAPCATPEAAWESAAEMLRDEARARLAAVEAERARLTAALAAAGGP